MLRPGNEGGRFRRRVQPHVARIRHHTDDSTLYRAPHQAYLHEAADRVLSRKEPPGEALVHDDDPLATPVVGIRERSPLAERDAQRLEVRWPHHRGPGHALLARHRGHSRWNHVGLDPGDVVRERQRRSHRCQLHSRQGAEPVDHLAHELVPFRQVGVLVVDPDREREHMIASIAALGGEDEDEAARQQCGADQQHQS